jgi:hypothetical protein
MSKTTRQIAIVGCIAAAGLLAFFQPGSQWGWFLLVALLLA